jgi:hypothetical protein
LKRDIFGAWGAGDAGGAVCWADAVAISAAERTSTAAMETRLRSMKPPLKIAAWYEKIPRDGTLAPSRGFQ